MMWNVRGMCVECAWNVRGIVSPRNYQDAITDTESNYTSVTITVNSYK